MFTVDDIRDIAVQIEINGEKTYRRAAAAHEGSTDIVSLFQRMAAEEREHRDWFESLRSSRQLDEQQRELERMGRRLLREMIEDQTFSLDEEALGYTGSLVQTLEQSRQFEQDTILFYEFLQGIVDEASARDRIASIIEEERRHVEQITAMIEQVKKTGGAS